MGTVPSNPQWFPSTPQPYTVPYYPTVYPSYPAGYNYTICQHTLTDAEIERIAQRVAELLKENDGTDEE